jgi:serine/threonine-protein kinase RsbW
MNGMETRIRNRLDELPAIATMVEDFGIKHSISGVAINELNLVLDEVLSNIILHGYSGNATGQIIVRLNYKPGEISAEVHDDGKPFDPLQADSPDVSGTVQSRKVGGLGIHFVKELMDNVAYARVGNENRLVVRKKLPV